METLNPVQRRIHQAALRLFAEKGASQVNISDLAQEAGVARAPSTTTCSPSMTSSSTWPATSRWKCTSAW